MRNIRYSRGVEAGDSESESHHPFVLTYLIIPDAIAIISQIAGRIVPAVATTTALVSGLVCLELVKIASERVRSRRLKQTNSGTDRPDEQERDRLVGLFRNSFVNVARPMLAFAQPVLAETYTIAADADPSTEKFTLWDTLQVRLVVSYLATIFISSSLLFVFTIGASLRRQTHCQRVVQISERQVRRGSAVHFHSGQPRVR